MFRIGLDLGYGYVKGISQEGKTVFFPSLVGNAYSRNLTDLFGGGNNGIINNLHISLAGGDGSREEFFVGELARREGRNVRFVFDGNKINHPNTKALLLASTGLLAPAEDIPLHIVTGLPLEQYVHQKDSFREMICGLKMIVEFKGFKKMKVVGFDKVTIFPQAAGAVYAAIWDEIERYLIKGSYIGLIDVGQKTTDYIVFYIDSKSGRLVLREDLSGTMEVGMINLDKAADKLFSQKTGAKLDIPELMQLVDSGELFYKGENISLKRELNMAKSELSRTIKDRVRTAWAGKMDFFNTVFLAGGGAKTLRKDLLDIYEKTVLVKRAQMANAEGFLKVAQSMN